MKLNTIILAKRGYTQLFMLETWINNYNLLYVIIFNLSLREPKFLSRILSTYLNIHWVHT
jgi:hypothetical protein